jgi:hypothetical protein
MTHIVRDVEIRAFLFRRDQAGKSSQTHRKVGTESHGSVTDSRVAFLRQEIARPAFYLLDG